MVTFIFMPDQFQSSSFIPKGGAQYSRPTARPKDRGGLLFTISLVLASVAGLAAGGVFFYTQYLEANLTEKQNQFITAQAAFEPEIIGELERLDTRISSAQNILAEHTAATPVFDVIESITLAGVQLTAVSLSAPGHNTETSNVQAEEGATTVDSIDVSMSGLAPDYAAVALQSEALSTNEAIQDPELSEFLISEEGDVEFTAKFSLPARYMLYQTTI